MRVTTLTMVTLAVAGTMAAAGHTAVTEERRVTVCSAMAPGPEFGAAHMLASEMFARIGVKLEWRGPAHCPAGALQVTVSTRTPEDLKPGALAYALPFEGSHIVVIWDRVQATVGPRVSVLLAHVLAHEITHILEGLCRHSDSGLMKAYWDGSDYRGMNSQPMAFAGEDVELIYAGLARRAQGAVVATY